MGQVRNYEALIRELLAGVAGGWSYGNVIVLLMTKGVDESDLALWLREFAEGLSLERDRELIEQLKLLGKMTPGKLASEALAIAAKFDRSDEQGSELLNHEVWFDRGNELYELGQYEEAIASYDRAIEIKPDYRDAWFNRGVALRNLGRYEEVIASYKRVIEIKPDDYEAWFNRGVALFKLGSYEDAIASYERVIEIKHDFHKAWSNRGDALDYSGRCEDAIASYDRAIEIKPDYHKGWFNRGVAIGILHGYQAEINAYQEAFQHIKSGTHPEGWGFLQHRIGLAYYEEGKNQSFNYRKNPQPYYYQALTSYQLALQTLTREEFPQLRIDTLIDTAKVHLALRNTPAALEYKLEALDILRDLLNAQPTFEGKKRL